MGSRSDRWSWPNVNLDTRMRWAENDLDKVDEEIADVRSELTKGFENLAGKQDTQNRVLVGILISITMLALGIAKDAIF